MAFIAEELTAGLNPQNSELSRKRRERYLNHILSASADCGKLGA
jgi:hypothetical protein